MSGSKQGRITGWVLTVLVTLFLGVVSAYGKFFDFPGKDEMFSKMGFTPDVMFKIGIVEVVIAIMILIPRVSFLGGILATAYLGGATAAHVRIEEAFVFPIIIGIVMWIGLGLRSPEIFRLAFGSKKIDPT